MPDLAGWLALLALVSRSIAPATSPRPTIAYRIVVDSARTDVVRVTLHVEHAPASVRLAMKVHPEYDARFWRYLELEGSGVTRLDSTLWSVALPSGRGDIAYTIHLPAPTDGLRDAWRSVVRADGALLNSPDVLLYLPDFADAPATVDLLIPPSWRVATSLPAAGSPRRRTAANAAELLDSPILLGRLREWTFRDGENAFAIDYWPLPDATPFDTTALVDEIRRLSHAALGVFGRLPAPSYHFLLQDGAGDALEHRASVTIGVPSSDLARDPRTHLTELAHEFFHTWNLVAIHPDTYGRLTYGRTAPTTGLWWGEGVTIYYADALPRRAGLVDSTRSRSALVAELLSRYLAAPWRLDVSPEAASLAFRQTALENANATGGYYLQGQLLGHVLDALVRDATNDRRSLDDVLRALDARSRGGVGYTARDLQRITDSVCSCRSDRVFTTQVRAAGTIDLGPAMARLGWRIAVDTIAAVDDRGAPMPDLRVSAALADTTLRLVLSNPASAWRRAGLRTGDELVALDGASFRSVRELFAALRRLRVGDRVVVETRRGGVPSRLELVLPGYDHPRVRLVDAPGISDAQRARRARWLAGW